jgi:ubiquinone/menaquinone biosynthesis C-methylase UbiE
MASDQEWSAAFARASNGAMSFYDDIMVPRLFEPWAHLLLDRVHLEGGQAVLDVACGPGTVTRLVAARVGPTGRVTGCDVSPAMLDLARAKALIDDSAPIDYLQCPADALDVPDNSVDLVTCQQGLQFFSDRLSALAEMRRVLRPGGELGIAVWCDIEECPPFAALANALEEVLGPEVAATYRGGPWGFGDSTALVRLAVESGFTDVEVDKFELPVVFEGGPRQLQLTLGAASVATAVAQLSEADLSSLSLAIDRATHRFTTDGVVRSQAASYIVTARVNEAPAT